MARLFYFGRLTDLMGCSEETLALPASIQDSSALRHWLDTKKGLDGALSEPTIRLAVNDTLVAEPTSISNADEIAFLPPVGGG